MVRPLSLVPVLGHWTVHEFTITALIAVLAAAVEDDRPVEWHLRCSARRRSHAYLPLGVLDTEQLGVQPFSVNPAAIQVVESWHRWVAELEDHPLDMFEYEAMLMTRDDAAIQLEIAGSSELWVRCDEIDVRFSDITREVSDGPFNERASSGWWRRRVPSDADSLRYLRGDY